ncbi:hypothetical protein [Dyadobacter chenhuakuii]|uniref:Uncharacterized protein n=1 Tax=Dyadobacter chenhuakuii TaxID=2909339 RepID=A0A9X1QH86_9BACT|nr:hypothetical protein [Dyadobacter chenhuakuii]MCF2501511.1 hypothetical protein [Dyadobacter chenhuakuii]
MKKAISNIIILLIYLTPFFGINEVCTFLLIESPLPIIYYKAPKEGLLVILLILASIYHIKNGIPRHIFFVLLCLLSFTVIVFIFSSGNLFTAVAGLRWSLPFFTSILLIGLIDLNLLRRLALAMSIFICFNFVTQIYEMYNMPAIRGFNQFGLSGRVSGFFSNASMAGVVACFTFFLVRYFAAFGSKAKLFIYLMCIASVFLSMSSTGIAVLILLLFSPLFLKSSHKLAWILGTIPVGLALFLNLDLLSGRQEGSSDISFSTRIDIFLRQFTNVELISSRFGEATNTAVNLNKNLFSNGDAYISDSLFTSMLTNYGLIFFIGFLIILFMLVMYVLKKEKDDLTVFFVMSLLCSIPLIIVEIYPVNLIISVMIAYYTTPQLVKKRRVFYPTSPINQYS